MNCNYLANGSINCIENFSEDEINDFDSKNFRLYSSNANLTGLIIDNELFTNDNRSFQVRAYIDGELRSKSLRSKDIIKIPNHTAFPLDIRNKNVFLLTIYGNSTKGSDENKNINLKIEIDGKEYDLIKEDNSFLKYTKNSRFESSLKSPLKFTVLNSNNGITLPDNYSSESNKESNDINEVVVTDTNTVSSDTIIEQNEKLNDDIVEEEISINEEIKVSDNVKECLNSFLDCNKLSDNTVVSECLDNFLRCNKELNFDNCSKEFVMCNNVD